MRLSGLTSLKGFSTAAACLLFWGPSALAFDLERTIAYIECTVTNEQGGQTKTTGSGVVVSPRGHVLTARHVAPSGSVCRASLSVREENNTERLVHRPNSIGGYDVALLQLSRTDDYDFLKYCPLSDNMIRKPIFTAGFPLGTTTGKPSFRAGIMSTIFPTNRGFIETDSLMAEGMSGGPVLADDEKSLIGIISGAQFLADGTPEFYGITPIDGIQATQLQLQANPDGCYVPEPTTQELLDKIAELEAQLKEKSEGLESQITQKAKELDGKFKEKTEALDGKLTANAGLLTEINTKMTDHANRLVDHTKSLASMEDHPDRLKSAEGTLSEVESNIEWSASILEDTGSIRISYKKIVSSGGGINEIGLFIAPFYTTRRTDGEEGFVNRKGPTLASFNPDVSTLKASASQSKLGGSFVVERAITNGFIAGQYNLNRGTYHPDHPLTELNIRVTPVREGELGENVSIRLRIPQDQWKRIYDNYVENAQNGF